MEIILLMPMCEIYFSNKSIKITLTRPQYNGLYTLFYTINRILIKLISDH